MQVDKGTDKRGEGRGVKKILPRKKREGKTEIKEEFRQIGFRQRRKIFFGGGGGARKPFFSADKLQRSVRTRDASLVFF